jgi:GntR family transcriptional regulator
MRLTLDHHGPVPLYHQIAEAIRYRVATGKLLPGARLPSVREAAAWWSVNLHTVRRAYQDLIRDGLVESRGAAGTRILTDPIGRAHRDDALAGFLRRVIKEAKERHRLAPSDLAGLLSRWATLPDMPALEVHFVECSESQCESHCHEVEEAWDVSARPWTLSREGEPPPGAMVGTYFHYNDIRIRWPGRLSEIAFVAIRPDPALRARLAPRLGAKTPTTVLLCEMDREKARNIAADLVPILPPARYRIVPHVVKRPGELLKSGGKHPILFAPRVWGALTPEERSDPRAIEVRYFIPPAELAELGERFGWRRRAARAS